MEQLPNSMIECALPQSGYFQNVAVRTYPWIETYTAEEYIDLLGTYSDHSTLRPESKRALFEDVGNFIERRYGGKVVKGYLSILYVAGVKE